MPTLCSRRLMEPKGPMTFISVGTENDTSGSDRRREAMMDAHRKGQVPSNEVDNRQLEMAREEGKAYQRSLDYMVEKVAHTGAKKTVDGYIVGIAQEEAEGMYHLNGEGELVWEEPHDENCHIEVSVSDATDHRFIPELDVEAALVSVKGERIGPFPVPFVWHPGLYHYGANIKIPRGGKYDVIVRIAPPQFARHDQTNGRRFAKSVEVNFVGIAFETGQDLAEKHD